MDDNITIPGYQLPLLGNIAKSHSPSASKLPNSVLPDGSLARRFLGQSGARELLPRARVAHCLRTPIKSTVEVLHSPARQQAIYRGLQTCGSVWNCPVCAARISEHRRKELGRAVAEWRDMGGRVLLITYTLRHKASDSLSFTLEGLLNARKRMRTGKRAVTFKAKEGLLGSVRALEVTHSAANGWHPHIHELAFIGSETPAGEIEREILARWSKITVSLGLRGVNGHSVDVKDTNASVADYIAKFGREPSWTAEHELTKAVVKKGREESRGPMGLLEDYVLGDPRAGVLFQEYAAEFKGERQLVWSPGLREQLLPELELTDEQVAGDTSDYPVHLAYITPEKWRIILGNDARAEVLEIGGTGDKEALKEFVDALVAAPPLAYWSGWVVDEEDASEEFLSLLGRVT